VLSLPRSRSCLAAFHSGLSNAGRTYWTGRHPHGPTRALPPVCGRGVASQRRRRSRRLDGVVAMAQDRIPRGKHGGIVVKQQPDGRWLARTQIRDLDGRIRSIRVTERTNGSRKTSAGHGRSGGGTAACGTCRPRTRTIRSWVTRGYSPAGGGDHGPFTVESQPVAPARAISPRPDTSPSQPGYTDGKTCHKRVNRSADELYGESLCLRSRWSEPPSWSRLSESNRRPSHYE
jgi:hypothetical protein